MKLRRQNLTSGGILVTMLVISGLVGLMLVAYLAMLSNQHKMSQRSQVWNNAITMCELGVEEALAHINYPLTTNFASDGWSLTNSTYRRTRDLNGGTVVMLISNDFPPTLVVTGMLKAPLLQTVSIVRKVRVKTKINLTYPDGILSRGPIATGGGGVMDSYNSTNSLESSNGMYSAALATDHVTLATTSKASGAIDVGNTVVFGSVATGPSGTVNMNNNGNVGSTTFNNNPAYDGQIESGHITDDVNLYIPDAVLPTDFGTASLQMPMPGSVNGTNYDYILNSGDYYLNSPLPSSSRILITGKVRFRTTQAVSITSGYVLLGTTNASLEWYSVQNIKLAGGGIINGTGLAKNLSIFGLPPVCLSVDYSGGSAFCGTIYAPRADIKLSGNSESFGAFVGNTFQLQGGMSFHYDEALAGDPRKSRFVAASWQEL